jgi:hypothetical protein
MEAKSIVLILFIVKTSVKLSREYNQSPSFRADGFVRVAVKKIYKI